MSNTSEGGGEDLLVDRLEGGCELGPVIHVGHRVVRGGSVLQGFAE